MPRSRLRPTDDREHLAHQQRRQPHRGFVHQDQARLCHQRAADRQHLLLAARQIAGEPGALLQAREIGEHPLHVFGHSGGRSRVRAETKVLDHRHVLNDAATFHHLEDAAMHDAVRRQAGDLLAIEPNAAAGDRAILDRQQAGDRLQRGRLARPVGAEERGDASPARRKAQPAQHEDDVVEDDLDVLDLEDRLNGRRATFRCCRGRFHRGLAPEPGADPGPGTPRRATGRASGLRASTRCRRPSRS